MKRVAVGVALLLAAAPDHGGAIDHTAFDALLRRHVSAGLVDYDAFEKAPAFARYLDALAAADPVTLEPGGRLAYWINVYNAFTIHLINVHGERRSIRNINKLLGLIPTKGPWKQPIVRAANRTLTLDQVEHEILRKRFREPRIHFALVCAARSCPPLRSEAYDGRRLEQQLDAQARTFLLDSPAHNRVDLAAGIAYVSPIFDWFAQDFGGRDAVPRFIARYHPDGPARRLLLSDDVRLVHTPYDWSLNSQPAPSGE